MKYNLINKFTLIAFTILMVSCQSDKDIFIQENIDFATKQTKLMLEKAVDPKSEKPRYPHTSNSKGELASGSMYGWTPGFFPGSLWYLYELTNDTTWRASAEEWTESLEPLKTFTGHHDLGFMMYCSYGNASRLAHKEHYDPILIESAASLSSRYNDTTKVIKSWNYRKAWNDTIEWFYPVIIDNMMNLEMLFHGSKLSGNDHYANVAITHANTTLENHFRDDFSSYHVVDYDIETGAVKDKATCQGYHDESMWARGQAWAIYGYTMMYRETKDSKYLDVAKKMADVYIAQLPEDLIPLWDFYVNKEGYEAEGKSYAVEFKGENLKDVSAAAITCSALFELADFSKNDEYGELAIKMLHTLASDDYRAQLGENANFLLMHSVGSIPHKSEIDVPLVYADYYFLEALQRYKNSKY